MVLSKYTFFIICILYYFPFCLFTDVPDAPGKPAPSDLSPTSVTLTWTPPSSDGGSPITGYTVEMKDKFSTRWTKATRELISETTVVLPDLKEKEEYQFRVIAENKAGQSKPSPELQVTAKYPFGE